MKDSIETLERVIAPDLDAVLGRAFGVLDDGFVRVVDYMGNDSSIVQAARVSYGTGTKRRRQDRALIRHLMRHYHTSPFEMCEIKLHLRVPMDTWRQWVRHRTASINEYSTRYSVAIDAAQATPASAWRVQDANNKQGSAGLLTDLEGAALSEREEELHSLSREVYNERLSAGVAREQARKDLPLSTYTEAYWKVDLHNLLGFLRLRLAESAQLEIRSYAQVIAKEVVQRWCPITWEAFVDYRDGGLNLSSGETRVINSMLTQSVNETIALATSFGWLNGDGGPVKMSGERREFEAKASSLGLKVPW